MRKIIHTTLASALADAGTLTLAYPAGTDEGSFYNAVGHKVVTDNNDVYSWPEDFTLTFGTASITLTWANSRTLPVGTGIIVQLEMVGDVQYRDPRTGVEVAETFRPGSVAMIRLGAPDTADPNGVVESQACTAADGLATGINGALASGGVATFDVPRAAVAAWTGTAVLTVTGTDVYGNTVVESSASGTSLTGKKAFKTITGVSSSADITGLTVGTGDVLGLPVALPGTGYVLAEMEDGAAPTAGTVVAAVRTEATATTGDVRGTYDPNSACNGAKVFDLVVFLNDPGDIGIAQYAG